MDELTLAGRAWIHGDLPAAEYFAMARRRAFGPAWLVRLRGWWNTRRR